MTATSKQVLTHQARAQHTHSLTKFFFLVTTTAPSPRRGAVARRGMQGAEAMDVDSTASGAVAGAVRSDEIDDIDAITCLAQIWRQVPLVSVPKRVHVCVSGTTELAHAEVHRDFNSHIPQSDIAERAYSANPKDAFFLLNLTKLLEHNRVHKVFFHTLDGECVLPAFRQQFALDPLQNLSFVVVLLVLLWFRKLTDQEDVFILNMCAQGKHRSVYMARLLYMTLSLLKLCLHLPYELTFEWISAPRVIQEVATSSQGTRQHHRCAADVVPGWHRHWQLLFGNGRQYHFVSVDLDDVLYGNARQNYTSNQFHIASCLQALTILPFQNFRTFVASGEHSLVQISNLLNQGNIIHSWVFFIRIGLKKMWPDQCMLCRAQEGGPVEIEWKEDVKSKFAKLIKNVEDMFNDAILTTPKAKATPAPRRAWADQMDSSSDEDSPGSSSQAQEPAQRVGVSLRTADEVSGMPQMTPQGSVAKMLPKSILKKPGYVSKPQPINVTEETRETLLLSIPDSQDYWQLNLCTTSRVLTSFGLVELDPKVEKEAWLIRRPTKGLPWLIMKSKDDEVQEMKRVAEQLLREQPRLQHEINYYWHHLTTITEVPVEKRDDMHPLYQLQFFLFMHMLSILLQGSASLRFGASATFVHVVGKYFWRRKQIDILALVARYLYALWSSPAVDAEAWNQGFYGFFIPNNQMRACFWWKSIQEPFLSQNDHVFCEEYCCVSRSVAVDGHGFARQLQEICERHRRSPVRVVPQFPHFHYWISHDALTPCGESSMTARILQPLRPSTSSVDATWGNNDGKPGMLKAENLVSETHCFFVC